MDSITGRKELKNAIVFQSVLSAAAIAEIEALGKENSKLAKKFDKEMTKNRELREVIEDLENDLNYRISQLDSTYAIADKLRDELQKTEEIIKQLRASLEQTNEEQKDWGLLEAENVTLRKKLSDAEYRLSQWREAGEAVADAVDEVLPPLPPTPNLEDLG